MAVNPTNKEFIWGYEAGLKKAGQPVAINAGQIAYDDSASYTDGTVGGELNKMNECCEEVTADVNTLKSQINEVEAGFPQKTASGAIVTIDDGADNVPVVSLTAEINPVQDLHGFDNPWPAGGGKNLFGFEEYLKANNATYTKSGETYTVTIEGSALFSNPWVFSDSDVEVCLSCSAFTAGTASSPRIDLVNGSNEVVAQMNPTSLAVSGIASKARINWSSTGTFTITEPMVEVGPRKTSFAPYSNICPISGWTGANVVNSRNYYGPSAATANNRIDNGNGGISGVANMWASDFIPVLPYATYTLNFSYYSSGHYGMAFYNSGKSFVSGLKQGETTSLAGFTFKVPADCYYVRFSVEGAVIDNDDVTMVAGDTKQDGVPYMAPVVYPISWETEAGTVYGGSLVLNQDGTADLTVGWAKYVITGNESWTAWDTHAYFATVLGNISVNDQTAITAISSVLPPATVVDLFTGDATTGISARLGNIYISASDYANKSALTGGEVVYILANPQTYHIENVDIVKTLYLLNNIWADTGDIDVTYRADPATFTAEQIRIMLNAMVAPVEMTTTASKAYSVNDFLIMDNVLYKVIANIASGGTITINTNVSATTIGEQITAILNS